MMMSKKTKYTAARLAATAYAARIIKSRRVTKALGNELMDAFRASKPADAARLWIYLLTADAGRFNLRRAVTEWHRSNPELRQLLLDALRGSNIVLKKDY